MNFTTADPAKPGSVSIDYVYVGPENARPSQEQLYVDFTDTADDRERYSSKTYGWRNFDLPDAWNVHNNGSVLGSVSIKDGNMTVHPEGSVNTLIVQPAESSATKPNAMQFDPAKAEAIQIRLKFKNVGYISGKNPLVAVDPYVRSSKIDTQDYIFTQAQVEGNDFFAVTIPLTAEHRAKGDYTKFRLYFTNMSFTSSSEVVIDYIYIGPETDVPAPQYTVTFKNEDGTLLQTLLVHKGESAVYTGTTPAKAYDSERHYHFSGWDKALSNITADTTFTATYTASIHSYTHTYEDAENHSSKCACGDSKTATHTWDNGKITLAPTCTAEGVRTYTCSVCNGTRNEIIEATSHTEVIDKAILATCTETGLTEGKHCSVCNVVLVAQEVIPAKGHTEVIDKAVAATCTAAGKTEGKHCSVCNVVLVAQEVIAAKGHTVVIDKAVAATCTETGLTEGKHCSVCNAVLVAQEVIAAKGHTEVIDKAVDATCTETGLTEGKHCSVCNAVLVAQTEIAALGHDPIYTNNGKDHTVSCSRCDVSEIEAHTYADGICICKAVEDPCLDTGLKFYRKSMDLQSYIGVNYMVLNSVAKNYDSFYVGVKQNDGEEVILEGTALGSAFTYFSMRTAAPQMTENLAATIYAVKDGITYHGETVNWCVRDGVMEQMNALTDLATEANRDLMTLMVDMLNYGAAAQIRFDNRTEDLANNKMTEAQLAYGTTAEPTVDAAIEEIANDGATVKFINKNLSLQSSIEMQLMINIKGYEIGNLEARIVYGDKTDVVELQAYISTYAQIIYDGIAAKDVREIVEITVYDKTTGEAVSNTVKCSIEALAKQMLPTQTDIVHAMMRYGDSAQKVYG